MKMDWDDLQGKWYQIFLLIFVVLISWIGSMLRKVFFKLPDELKNIQRKLEEEAQAAPPPVEPMDRLPQEVGKQKGDLEDFIDAIRHEAEKQQREAEWRDEEVLQPLAQEPVRPQARRPGIDEAEWENLKWEVIEPERPDKSVEAAGSPSAGKAGGTLKGANLEPAVQAWTAESTGSSSETTTGSVEIPIWLSLSELNQSIGVDHLLGTSLRKAFLLKEILSPPRVLRHRRRH